MIKHLLCVKKKEDTATLEEFIKVGDPVLQDGGWKLTSTTHNVYEKGGVRLCVVTDVRFDVDPSILKGLATEQYDYVVYPIVYGKRGLEAGVRDTLRGATVIFSEYQHIDGAEVTLDCCTEHGRFNLWEFFC